MNWASAWQDSKVHLPLLTHINGQWFGAPEAGEDMQFNFAQLIAHAAKTRPLSRRDHRRLGHSSQRRHLAAAPPVSPNSAPWKPCATASPVDAVHEPSATWCASRCAAAMPRTSSARSNSASSGQGSRRHLSRKSPHRCRLVGRLPACRHPGEGRVMTAGPIRLYSFWRSSASLPCAHRTQSERADVCHRCRCNLLEDGGRAAFGRSSPVDQSASELVPTLVHGNGHAMRPVAWRSWNTLTIPVSRTGADCCRSSRWTVPRRARAIAGCISPARGQPLMNLRVLQHLEKHLHGFDNDAQKREEWSRHWLRDQLRVNVETAVDRQRVGPALSAMAIRAEAWSSACLVPHVYNAAARSRTGYGAVPDHPTRQRSLPVDGSLPGGQAREPSGRAQGLHPASNQPDTKTRPEFRLSEF